MTSRLKNYNQEKNIKKQRAVELSHYLVDGEYDLDDELRVIFKSSERNHPIIKDWLLKTNHQSPSIEVATAVNRSAQTPLKISSETPKKFSGTIMWFCSNGDIKIFSASETLIICCSEDHYLKKIDHHQYFSPFFQL